MGKMYRIFSRIFKSRKKISSDFLYPDEILLDSTSRKSFDLDQMEGKLERPLEKGAIIGIGIFSIILIIFFSFRAFDVQISKGEYFSERADKNRLVENIIFAERGVVLDRNGVPLVWNEKTGGSDYDKRRYIDKSGFGHLLGFVSYPKKDSSGNWWRTEYEAVTGVEKIFDNLLKGENGKNMSEIDALGNVKSGNLIKEPIDGKATRLSIDFRIQEAMGNALKISNQLGFIGGAGVIMDTDTGEVIALSSFPEYNPNIIVEGIEKEKLKQYETDKRNLYLNRAIRGEYAPGSVVKPFLALAALNEKIIDPSKQILSTGALVLSNPYHPEIPSVFRDWKAHGWTNMGEALAVSSDVYFYVVGGGFGTQKGLGINKISEYARKFGFGSVTGIDASEGEGNIPTPEWKEAIFGKDAKWTIGDTYHTSIGQFGFLITPIQAAKYVATVANGGKVLTPSLITKQEPVFYKIDFTENDVKVVRDGMRLAVTNGTAISILIPGLEAAAKTGTAEVGKYNEFMNSWMIGFWPYKKPKFAFAVVLERAPAGTNAGAGTVLRNFFEEIIITAPEYVRGEYPDAKDFSHILKN